MASSAKIKIVDIFAGPGGLGEGFSSFIEGNEAPFKIVLSAEKDPAAHKTLTLRAFFRRFKSPDDVPEAYYQIVRGEISAKDLEGQLAEQWKEAEKEALLLELGPESARLHKEIKARIKTDDEPWVLVGGPPCQAYSLAGRSRNKGKKDYVAEDDIRHYLYREYLQILSDFAPPVFIMENVKGILTAAVNGKRMFPTILQDLHDPKTALGECSGAIYDIYPLSADGASGAYEHGESEAELSRFLVRAEDLGVPQARHRVILLGIKRDHGLAIPQPMERAPMVTVGEVIRDLPKLRSGLSRGDSDDQWLETVEQQQKKVVEILAEHEDLQDVRYAVMDTQILSDAPRASSKKPDGRSHITYADWYHDCRLKVTLNHDSRGHMPSDLGRYLYCAAFAQVMEGRSPTTRREDFPSKLKAKHKNWDSGKFANRFKVQSAEAPSSTIVSHISKDGHYFIHHDPAQCRSFTVREAARAQTFPDNYFFMGGRTDQYHQVGNAVPPLLARKIAEVVWGCMKGTVSGR
ncbi:DNA cytosine methyltransferase [Lysobacter sp. A286]